MATKVILFGKVKVIKRNPWFSGKLASLVKSGLAKVKKEFILADLPPWYEDPSKLSKAQVYQVIRFSQVAHRTRGQSMRDRILAIKREASGPTGMAQPKARVELPRIGRIITIAQAYGISVPAELMVAPTPAPTPAVGVIRE